jgi:hypothetical protein
LRELGGEGFQLFTVIVNTLESSLASAVNKRLRERNRRRRGTQMGRVPLSKMDE